MAVTFRGKTTGAWATYNSVNITLPAGTQAGDLLILHVKTNVTGTKNYTTPSGATDIIEALTNGVFQYACWKIATSTDISNGYLAMDLSPADCYYSLLAFSGTHQTNPISGSQPGSGNIAGTSATITLDSALTPSANCMFAFFAGASNDGIFTTCSMATSDPTFSLDFTANNTVGADTTYGVWHSGVRSASTSTGNITVGTSGSLTASLQGLLVAIQPPASVDVTVSATVLTATFSIPALTITATQNITISQGAPPVATFSIPAYTAQISVSVSPSAQVLTFSIPAYDVIIADVSVSPATQVLTFSIPALTVSAERFVTISPDPVSLTMSIPVYETISSVSVDVAVQVLTFSLPSPDVSGGATISPAVNTLTLSIPSYTASGIRNINISASVLAMTFSTPAPSITATRFVIIDMSPIILTLTIPAYTIVADFWQEKYASPNTSWSDKHSTPAVVWSDKY